jgi:hypothetical protein
MCFSQAHFRTPDLHCTSPSEFWRKRCEIDEKKEGREQTDGRVYICEAAERADTCELGRRHFCVSSLGDFRKYTFLEPCCGQTSTLKEEET